MQIHSMKALSAIGSMNDRKSKILFRVETTFFLFESSDL